VRVRKPKSAAEAERYTLANCALEAKIVPEKTASKAKADSYNASIDNGQSSNNTEKCGSDKLHTSTEASALDVLPREEATDNCGNGSGTDEEVDGDDKDEDESVEYTPRRNMYEDLDSD
jgi:hypothetical protein